MYIYTHCFGVVFQSNFRYDDRMTAIIPIFPLQMVLFPTQSLRLRIFEPRYLRMIKRCLEENKPFGVTLIREGMEAYGPLPLPYPCGTTARIKDFEETPKGQIDIFAQAEERFRITNLKHGMPYLVAEVEWMLLPVPFDFDSQSGVNALEPWLDAYYNLLRQITPNRPPRKPFIASKDRLDYFYMAAGLLEVPPIEKQKLLELASAGDFTGELLRLYRREVSVLKNTFDIALETAKKSAEDN